MSRRQGSGSSTAPRRCDRAVGVWTVVHLRFRGVLPIKFISNRVDAYADSDGAIVSHSVAWAQMGRYHNDC